MMKNMRLLNQLGNLFWKDDIRRKVKAINNLLEKCLYRVPEQLNYITSKNTEVSTQTNQQIKNYAANNNH